MRLSRFAVLLGLLGLTAPAFSDVMYTYTGPNFTTVWGAYTTSDHISGYFTVTTPLAPSKIVSMIPIASFSFNDGVETLTNTTPNLIQIEDDFTTNASGAITAADFIIIAGNRTLEYGMGFGSESTDASSPNGEAQSPQWVVGTWSGPFAVDPSATTPEPSSLALLATGLAGVAGVIRRRIV